MRRVHRKCKLYVDIVELHIKLCTQIRNLPKTTKHIETFKVSKTGANFLSQSNSRKALEKWCYKLRCLQCL